MARSYNGLMGKVIQFFSRYSIGKNSSVRELPEQDDPNTKILVQKQELNPEFFSAQIKKSKEQKKAFSQEAHI